MSRGCLATAARTRRTANDPVRKHLVALVANEAGIRRSRGARRFIRSSNPLTQRRGDLNEATAATPAANSPTSPPFDPASLPSLQSITAGTDIRLFLGSNVPVELTKAALRRTWVTDPAIRDFIGIAENQWDFNDPTAMPGFGPLKANDVSAVAGAQQTLAGLGEAEQARGPTKDAVDAEAIPDTRQIDEIDRARAQEYALLAALLSHSPDTQMIEHLSRLSGDTTQLGAAHAALSAAAAGAETRTDRARIFRSFRRTWAWSTFSLRVILSDRLSPWAAPRPSPPNPQANWY